MSRLIVPAHAKGMTSGEAILSEARNATIQGFLLILPGQTDAVAVTLPAPIGVEQIVAAVVGVAVEQLMKKQAETVADKILGSPNGQMN